MISKVLSLWLLFHFIFASSELTPSILETTKANKKHSIHTHRVFHRFNLNENDVM